MGVQTSQKIDGVTEIYPGAVILPGGGRTMLVHASGAAALNDLPAGFAGNPDGFFTSVNSAGAACRANRGDKIIMLPGHTESIAAADGWSGVSVAGVEIVGLGSGTDRPTITWTAPTSSVLFDVANMKLRNCRLFLAGAHAAGAALTVAAPITVSAAGCEITDSEIAWGFDADQIVTIGITTTAAGDNFAFDRNDCYAETAAVPTTTFMRLVGADFMRMYDTRIIGPGSTTTLGPVQFLTTASLKIDWRRSIVASTLAASIHAVTGLAGVTGTVKDCSWGILDNATLAGFVTPANVQFFGCNTTNLAGENAAAMTPVST